MPKKDIRIIVIDDHPIVVEGLKLLFEMEDDLKIIDYALDINQALVKIEKHKPDLVIVDLSLKGGASGLELIKTLKSLYPDLLMLTLSMHDESMYAERAVRAGSRGYIMKQEMSNTIVEAIRRILSGKIYLSNDISMNLLDSLIYKRKDNVSGEDMTNQLTDRELETFKLISDGLKNKDIAKKMNLGVKTIETYKLRLKEKFNIKSSNELIKIAIEWFHKKS